MPVIRSPIRSPFKRPLRAPFDYSGGATATPSAVPLSQMLYVPEGDSLTSGGLGGSVSYATRYFNANAARVVFRNTALGGRDLAGIITNATTVDGYLTTTYAWCQKKILTVFAGANDMNSTPSATFLTDYAAYCDARRAAGWTVVIATVMPRAPSAGGSGTTETWRATVNAALRTWVGSHCDAIMDFDADPFMGSYAEAALFTYFQDGVHPTDAGFIRMYDIAKYAISGLTSLQTDAQFSAWSSIDKSPDLTLSGSNYVAGSNAAPGNWRSLRHSVGRDTGKWYAELLIGGSNDVMFGLTNGMELRDTWIGRTSTDGAGNSFSAIGLWPASNGNFNVGVTQVNAPTIAAYVVGDRCGLFVDFDAGKIWFARNNTFVASGNPATGANPNFTFTPNRMLFVGGSFNAAAGSLTLPANAGALAYPLLTGWSAF